MKKHIVGVFGLALLLAAASADAQIAQTTRVLVPFPFVAAGQNMPAADYSVLITKDTGLIILRSPGRSAAALSIRDVHPGKESYESYLKFERHGNSWVLEEVNHDGIDQVLRKSKIEQQLARLKPSGQQTLMASNLFGH
jgi:hypothetical protein